MVQIRRIRRGDEFEDADQTEEVIGSLDGKQVPTIEGLQGNTQPEAPTVQTPPSTSTGPVPSALPAPPLPPTGLPDGWTMEQWAAYGHQYMEMQSK